MRKLFTFLIAIFSSDCFSEEFLSPEDSVYTGLSSCSYAQVLVDYFNEAFKDSVLARVIVAPSFFPEYAIMIEKEGELYSVSMAEPEKKLWAYAYLLRMGNGTKEKNNSELEAFRKEFPDYPDDYHDVPHTRCHAPLQKEKAERLVALWEEFLLNTRYTKKSNIGLDGISYHFSMKIGYKGLAGKVWSPDEESKTGKLVKIANSLRAYCKSNDEKDLAPANISIQNLANGS